MTHQVNDFFFKNQLLCDIFTFFVFFPLPSLFFLRLRDTTVALMTIWRFATEALKMARCWAASADTTSRMTSRAARTSCG